MALGGRCLIADEMGLGKTLQASWRRCTCMHWAAAAAAVAVAALSPCRARPAGGTCAQLRRRWAALRCQTSGQTLFAGASSAALAAAWVGRGELALHICQRHHQPPPRLGRSPLQLLQVQPSLWPPPCPPLALPQALMIATCFAPDDWPLLIITPATMKLVWEEAGQSVCVCACMCVYSTPPRHAHKCDRRGRGTGGKGVARRAIWPATFCGWLQPQMLGKTADVIVCLPGRAACPKAHLQLASLPPPRAVRTWLPPELAPSPRNLAVITDGAVGGAAGRGQAGALSACTPSPFCDLSPVWPSALVRAPLAQCRLTSLGPPPALACRAWTPSWEAWMPAALAAWWWCRTRWQVGWGGLWARAGMSAGGWRTSMRAAGQVFTPRQAHAQRLVSSLHAREAPACWGRMDARSRQRSPRQGQRQCQRPTRSSALRASPCRPRHSSALPAAPYRPRNWRGGRPSSAPSLPTSRTCSRPVVRGACMPAHVNHAWSVQAWWASRMAAVVAAAPALRFSSRCMPEETAGCSCGSPAAPRTTPQPRPVSALQTLDTQRTRVVTAMARSARRVILCTGTPALARPLELFPQASRPAGRSGARRGLVRRLPVPLGLPAPPRGTAAGPVSQPQSPASYAPPPPLPLPPPLLPLCHLCRLTCCAPGCLAASTSMACDTATAGRRTSRGQASLGATISGARGRSRDLL